MGLPGSFVSATEASPRPGGGPTYVRLVAVYIAAIMAVPLCYLAPMLWWTLVPCTVYSEDYNESAFQAVHVGQPLDEVLVSLGPPYRVVPPYMEAWEYDGWTVFFDEAGMVEVEALYQWDREQIAVHMGKPPAGVTIASLAGSTRGELLATFGEPIERSDGGFGGIRNFFYSHPSEGGMWADRTWKKRLLVMDRESNRIKEKGSYWVVAGDAVK